MKSKYSLADDAFQFITIRAGVLIARRSAEVTKEVQPDADAERQIIMRRLTLFTPILALLIAFVPLQAQQPAARQISQDEARQIAQERASAEADAPKLADVLGLKPGMAVADIGTGSGAMAVVLGKWIGSGRVYATDITERALQTTREYAKAEGLTYVTQVTAVPGARGRVPGVPGATASAVVDRDSIRASESIPLQLSLLVA